MRWLPYHHDWALAYQCTLGLRVHWFGRYAGYPEWAVPTSRLAADMVNFFFVETSSCWAIINGTRLELKTGDLLVVSGADEFSYGHDPANPHVSTSACLALEHGSLPNVLLQRKFRRIYSWPDPAAYTVEFDRVLHAFSSTSTYRDLEIAGALCRWLSFLLSNLQAPLDATFAHDRSIVDKLLTAETWANSRLKQNITLAEWAGAVGMNPVYFGRVFKREIGLRPMEWLIQRRLQVASQYLSSTPGSVREIAELCGFTDQFYFSRAFRRHFGRSPLQYRKSRF